MNESGFLAEDASGYDIVPAPISDAERLARLRLIRSRRVGPTTFRRLIAGHGSATAALQALPEMAQAAGEKDYAPCPEAVARAEMKTARRAGARLLCLGEQAYPATLAAIPDAPAVLWLLGDMALLSRPMVAMVGSRNASSLGRRMARYLARDLGKAGFAVVSGLARGIDAEAHRASLATGTVAVQAGGVDVLYPPENAALAREIGQTGLRLAEHPCGLAPQGRHFPRRNRIISGLARAVIVVEAAARSGSLITARMALDQGREVLAVPGHPLDTRASGCNMLIRDGAPLVRSARDVFDVLGAPETRPSTAPARRDTAPAPMPETALAASATEAEIDSRILALLSSAPMEEDQLIRDLGLPANAVTSRLVMLEIRGHVLRASGGTLSRT